MLYALIDDTQLLLGPIRFNSRLINDELEDLEVDYRVNANSYTSVPIQITETIKLLPARYEAIDHDARFEYLTNVTHQITETEVVFTYSKEQKPLEQIKEERKALVTEERKKLENTTININLNGDIIPVSTSKETRLSYTSKIVSSTNQDSYNFKFENNYWRQINSTELSFIVSKIDEKIQEVFDWELAKKEEIDNCQTKEEVYQVEVVTPQIG